MKDTGVSIEQRVLLWRWPKLIKTANEPRNLFARTRTLNFPAKKKRLLRLSILISRPRRCSANIARFVAGLFILFPSPSLLLFSPEITTTTTTGAVVALRTWKYLSRSDALATCYSCLSFIPAETDEIKFSAVSRRTKRATKYDIIKNKTAFEKLEARTRALVMVIPLFLESTTFLRR